MDQNNQKPRRTGTGWEEKSLPTEEEQIAELAGRITEIQIRAREKALKRNPNAVIVRGFHAKGMGLRAEFRVVPDLPEHLTIGLFRPGAAYDALVRFSNAQSEIQSDLKKDQRGLAIRVKTVAGEKLTPDEQTNIQDFVMANTPASFAIDPVEFTDIAELILGNQLMLIPKLWKRYRLRKAIRILAGILRPIGYRTWQASQFWSRTPYKFGDLAVKFTARPTGDGGAGSLREQIREFFRRRRSEENYLRNKIKERLDEGDVMFDFGAQLFADEERTPIEDASKEWKVSDAAFTTIAQLVIPKQNLDESLEKEIERMAFTPWNTDEYRPLGFMNRARKKVYDTSARVRGHKTGSVV